MSLEQAKNFVVKNYPVDRSWCNEPEWEEHTLTMRDSNTGKVVFNGTIKKLIETIIEEERYFGEGKDKVSNI